MEIVLFQSLANNIYFGIFINSFFIVKNFEWKTRHLEKIIANIIWLEQTTLF